MKQKLPYLESLRGLAAVSVSLLHFSSAPIITETVFIRNAEMMVDFFFVLSGFVIAYTYLDRIVDRASLIDFQTRRLWRLYPLHLVCLLAFLGLEGAQYAFESLTGSTGAQPAFSRNTPGAFLSNLFLVQPFFEQDLTFNFPSWSISSEFFTYFAFGLLVLSPTRIRLPAFVAVAVLSAVVLNVSDGIVQTQELALVRCMYSFFVGVLTYLALKPVIGGHHGWRLAGPLLVVSVVLICLPQYFPKLLLPLVFAACIAALVLEDNGSVVKRWLSGRRVVYLGTISYGVYMLHLGVWEAINILLVKGLRYPLTPDGSKIDLPVLEQALLAAAGLVVIVLGAHVSYRRIEQRWRCH